MGPRATKGRKKRLSSLAFGDLDWNLALASL